MFVKKNGWGKLLVMGLMLALLLGSSGLIMPGPAIAAISVTVSGNGVTTPSTFSQAQLEAMTQVQANYSTINAWPTKNMYVAKGVKLADLLTSAGIKVDGTLIKVTSTDGVSMTFTRKELLDDTRYYYPGLKANAEFDGSVAGSPDGAVPVDTLLAMQSSESADPAKMNDLTAPRLIMGQRWVTEQTNNGYAKYINKIEVLTESPSKWENPVAAPVNGTVAAGTKVALSTSDMNVDSIYYTTDGTEPTFKSPIYNSIKKRFQDSREADLLTINHPIDVNQNMTIKAVAIGFGKKDSDIVAFNYQVSSKPVTPTVFSVDGNGATSKSYTTAELKAMNSTTGIYSSKTGDLSCKGVALKDLLTALNINDSSWTVQINTTDAATYPVAPTTVSAILDTANKYLLTYEIDGQAITGDATTLRVYWSGKVIKNVTGIAIFKELLPKELSYGSSKKWTISFNQPLLNSQVLSDHIYVVNSAGNKEAVNVMIKETDQKIIEVLAPVNCYLPGDYTLWINSSLQSTTGTLKPTFKMKFKIAGSN